MLIDRRNWYSLSSITIFQKNFANQESLAILKYLYSGNSMNPTQKLWLLFLGRLESEKGFDIIFDFLNQYPNKELPFELYVFGAGSYEKGLLELAHRFKEIHFFGWKPLSEVERYLENIDYCLMPSRFLETFWLSAINVLKRGIPVVGYKKWGLIPFIPEEYAIERCEGSTDFAKFATMLHKLEQEKKEKNAEFYLELSQKSKEIATRYTKEKWLDRFRELSFGLKGKKIVMVSDFINKIWGIETYIHDVKSLLEAQGYEVKLFGNTCPSGSAGKLKKLFWIGLASFNLWEAIRFFSFIKKEKPDLIWYHSMLRRMGWFPLRATKSTKAEKWMMYHDFGYFAPYPHLLSETKELNQLSLLHYLKLAQTKNPIKFLQICGKYLTLSLLRKQLKKQIQLHLVPSAFMIPVVHKSWGISESRIKAFNHFLQE